LSAESALWRTMDRIHVDTCDFPSKPPRVAPHAEEDFADEVLCQGTVIGQPQDEAIDPRVMPRIL
jgi:hypothetical protein